MKALLKSIPLLSAISFDQLAITKLAGLTNDNYLITANTQKYVLRIPRHTTNTVINREHESYNLKLVMQLGIAPKMLWQEVLKNGELTGASLTEYIDNCVALTPDYLQNANCLFDNLKAITAILSTLWSSENGFKNSLSNQSIARLLQDYFRQISQKQQKILQPRYQKALALLATSNYDRPPVPSHLDLVVDNILHQDAGLESRLWIIDWEYSAMASPFCDLATLCNAYDFDDPTAKHFLQLAFKKDYQEEDLACLKRYRMIMQSLTECWKAAFLR